MDLPLARKVDRPAVRLAVLYAAVGALWILLSDRALSVVVQDADRMTELQIYKGWFFVASTAVLLFLLCRSELRKRHRLEMQLRQQHKIEAIGMLAAGVAHEINNPLTGISNYAQMIHDQAAPNSETAEYSHEVMREAQRVGRIVRNLLLVARHETPGHPQPCAMAEVAEGTLSLIRALIRRDAIDLEVDLPDSLPPVTGDPQQLQQVLLNLLTNARDAVNARHGEERNVKRLSLIGRELTDSTGHWLRLTVADNGTGIPPELVERVFDPFFTTKPRHAGTGLGLSICNSIVQDHRGRLLIDSTPDHGTTVHVDLPLQA